MLDSKGKMRLRTYTAGGALPVSGAVVRITGAEEANSYVAYSLITDRDGLTESVELPAPSVNYSLTPSPGESPYAIYDVEITAPGYFTKRINGISVFSGVESIQLINMIPVGTSEDYPRGSINANLS